jgi:hypothetical protein
VGTKIQHRRRNENVGSEVGEASSLSPAEGARTGVRRIRLSNAADWDWRPLQLRALPPSTGSALDVIANSDSGSGSSCACKIRPAISGGCVSFPLTLALSLREREPPCCVFLKSGVAPTGTVRSAIQGCDARRTRRVRFDTQRRAILPLPKGEGRGEGEKSRPRLPDPCATLGRHPVPFQGARECSTEV